MLSQIDKEADLNKLIFDLKQDEELAYVLFYSDWDPYANILVEKLRKRTVQLNGTEVYLVNTLDCPHSWEIFRPEKYPALIGLKENYVYIETSLPVIYRKLRVR